MRLSRVFVRYFGIPFTCALMFMAVASSATFASTTQHTASAPCSVVLKRGSTDANSQGKVTILQQKLKADGEDLGSKGIDGVFGGQTEAAVKAYQGKSNHKDENGHPLLVDGIVGAHTWYALGECDAPAQSGQPPAQPVQPSDPNTIHVNNISNAGASGSATFTFTGQTQITNITMTLQDIKCDAHPVYIQLRIHDQYGDHDELQHNNDLGCNTTGPATWKGLSYTNRAAPVKGGKDPISINSVELRVCINDSIFSDTCTLSQSSNNPNVK